MLLYCEHTSKLMNGLGKIYLAKFTLYRKVIGFVFDFVEQNLNFVYPNYFNWNISPFQQLPPHSVKIFIVFYKKHQKT